MLGRWCLLSFIDPAIASDYSIKNLIENPNLSLTTLFDIDTNEKYLWTLVHYILNREEDYLSSIKDETLRSVYEVSFRCMNDLEKGENIIDLAKNLQTLHFL